MIVVEAVSKGHVAQGFVGPFVLLISISSILLLSWSDGIWFRPAMWSSYYATDSGQWKPYYDLLEHVVGHAVYLGEFSYVSFLTFMDFPSLTLTDIFSFVLSLFLISIFLLIHYLLFDWFFVCVFLIG